MQKIVHLTSAHPRSDIRIFVKQCRTLAAHGYDVTLVVADGEGPARQDGVAIRDVGRLHGRLNRVLRTTRRVLAQAIALDAQVYHLHDPELIPIGLRLKALGKTVFFDSHEDVCRQLAGKPYLGKLARKLVPPLFSVVERFACARFDGIVAATPFIRDLFLQINPATIDINNYPLAAEFDAPRPALLKRNQVCYVGAISGIRGIRQLVQASALLQSGARLHLAGRFLDPGAEAAVRTAPGWHRVVELGFLNRSGIRNLMSQSIAGVVTLLPVPSHIDSLPTKMFEYMAAGIPVIASDFPLWRRIVEGRRCGLCVDPRDPAAIAAAIDYLAAHPHIAASMGAAGRQAIAEEFNWHREATKLIAFYGERTHAEEALAFS